LKTKLLPFVLSVGVLLGTVPALFGEQPAKGFTITDETRQDPRPLKIYVLKIDLEHPGNELAIAVLEDPDGDGPAETTLMTPTALAKSAKLDVAVNATPWEMTQTNPDGKKIGYIEGGHCDIHGLIVKDGKARSSALPSAWSLWQDAEGKWHLGEVPAGVNPKQAVSGFGPLLSKGNFATAPSDVRHPRTAVGLDESGRYLTLAVVDGRQKGISEGMSEHELAELMKSLGCWDALNLDGGGSSVLMRDIASETPQIVNTPSGGKLRPIPVMVGLRLADQ
jgi:exopolysaccharide biosynthesis protein